ncbi:MAG: divergent polysaccharide deacetylase family protein [Gammaproteobacteria bacterium]|nr:divergent polysaccharide deacetylase family protein [Gammaproteobacteria bacterium]
MGSQVTPSSSHMDWLMSNLMKRGNLYFVDSMTTHRSIAATIAKGYGVPTIKRDVFLDHDASPEAIEQQFKRLVRIARRQGQALAIGHPYPHTLDALEKYLPKLQAMGIELVPVSQLMPPAAPVMPAETLHAALEK